MRRDTTAGLPLCRFDCLDVPGVVHGVTTRAGGVSVGPYASLNLSLHGGDAADRVLTNRRRVSDALGVPLDSWVAAQQVHRDTVAVVGPADRGRGAVSFDTAVPDTDALVTATPGLTLVTLSADCPLVGIVDPAVPAVGLAHASWRSTVRRIVARTVDRMVASFGCDAARMRAAVAPSAGPCCYEVGEEVREAARRSLARADRFLDERDGRLVFDLWSANLAQLVESGVPAEAVEVAAVCSICDDAFFSYRRTGAPVGHIGFLLGIRP